jgi:phthalate 4,5-cis-dihydrodiol dehydrogenase
VALRTAIYAYRGDAGGEPLHQPHFGLTIATCARGELRASLDGMFIYDEGGRREVAIPQGPGAVGRHNVLDELEAAIRTGKKPVHDGA